MIVKDTAELDFGAFPGKLQISQAVIGEADIPADAFVEVWLSPVATVDHSQDEHIIEGPRVFAGDVVAGVGFTIFGASPNNDRLYGKFTVNWVWSS